VFSSLYSHLSLSLHLLFCPLLGGFTLGTSALGPVVHAWSTWVFKTDWHEVTRLAEILAPWGTHCVWTHWS
jgi:hypothetical protein